MDWYTSHQFAPRKLALSSPSVFVRNNRPLHHSSQGAKRAGMAHRFLCLSYSLLPDSVLYPSSVRGVPPEGCQGQRQ